jgi:natural product precursor
MKKLKKLKLNNISKMELESRQMNMLKGGNCSCTCGCSCGSTNCHCPQVNPGEISTEQSDYNFFAGMASENTMNTNSGSTVHVPQIYY